LPAAIGAFGYLPANAENRAGEMRESRRFCRRADLAALRNGRRRVWGTAALRESDADGRKKAASAVPQLGSAAA